MKCAYKASLDCVAAMNLKARLTDPDITLWTPKERVKAILLERFAAQKRPTVLEIVEPQGKTRACYGQDSCCNSSLTRWDVINGARNAQHQSLV